jgi:hypothetical protein
MLEADATVLRKDALGQALFLYPDLDFLSPILRLYSVLEYKSPQDRLTWDDLDQGRIYGLLCKRKYHRLWDSEIAVIFLASAVAGDFYEVAEKNGFVFGKADKGIRCCRVQGPGAAEGMAFYVVNLLDLGQEYPDSLLNLLSARRHLYQMPDSGDGRSIMARDLLYATLSQELKKIMEQHKNMPGLNEVTEDLAELRRQVMAMHTVEERLAGISPEQRLAGLPPEQVLAAYLPEQRLAGLPPEQVLAAYPPEQRLLGLSAEQRTALLELLLKERSTK